MFARNTETAVGRIYAPRDPAGKSRTVRHIKLTTVGFFYRRLLCVFVLLCAAGLLVPVMQWTTVCTLRVLRRTSAFVCLHGSTGTLVFSRCIMTRWPAWIRPAASPGDCYNKRGRRINITHERDRICSTPSFIRFPTGRFRESETDLALDDYLCLTGVCG